MKRSRDLVLILAFALTFLFFIQLAGTLVESVYILDLMNLALDAKALGLLFFFSPILLFLFRRPIPAWTRWALFVVLLLGRGVLPYVNTSDRLVAAGVAAGSTLMLGAVLMSVRHKDGFRLGGAYAASAGLALAVVLSVFLRTLGHGLDLSLAPSGAWIGWVLGLLLGWTLTYLPAGATPQKRREGAKLSGALLGIYLTLTLVYFSFSAPAVIARWTQGNYVLIVTAVSLLSAGWVGLMLFRPDLPERISGATLLIWNLVFSISLTLTILMQRVSFPSTPEAAAVVVGSPTWLQFLPLAGMLLSFPVIFVDLRAFFGAVEQAEPSPAALAPGMLLGGLALVLLVFMQIFSNVWGYIEPVSGVFRNQFHLPYLLMAGGITALAWRRGRKQTVSAPPGRGAGPAIAAAVLGALCLGTTAAALSTARPHPSEPNKKSLVVMTYNIQQANDDSAERSYERQLALIRKISPDVLALQESDSARISLNNNDYVLYYAHALGTYAYYGPSTVTGTFGTAMLSKYPLENTHSVFTYSDTDEIGTAEAEIRVGGRVFSIYDVHPDGSDAAKMALVHSLIERSRGKPNLIALGDYNLQDETAALQQMATAFVNAWTSVHPDNIGADGIDLSGVKRIDHIFISPELQARSAAYILPPASASDHPVLWAEFFWGP